MSEDHLGRAMGGKLHARLVNLKRTAVGQTPASDELLAFLWQHLPASDRQAWDALWVGLVQRGYDGRSLDQPRGKS